MTATKKPAARKPAAQKLVNPEAPQSTRNSQVIETSLGFSVEVDLDRYRDMNTFILLGKVSTGENPFLLPQFVNQALGEEQAELLLSEVRKRHGGFAPVDVISEIMWEITGAIDPN